jgi:hypothetical protein
MSATNLPNPLASLSEYSRFLAELLNQAEVLRCTVTVWSDSPYTGTGEGEVLFRDGLRLRVREEVDFAEALITAYGYEVYRNDDRLFWYDDFPHPNDPGLAPSYPHHKHVQPDIKHNRIAAPEVSFTRPNRPVLLDEIGRVLAEG